jgi:hypothetical protein
MMLALCLGVSKDADRARGVFHSPFMKGQVPRYARLRGAVSSR